jgi:hypothetical protein
MEKREKLTSRMDDEIVNDLFEKFPEFKFDDALRNLDEDWMKSKAGKEKWRAFIMPVSPGTSLSCQVWSGEAKRAV